MLNGLEKYFGESTKSLVMILSKQRRNALSKLCLPLKKDTLIKI